MSAPTDNPLAQYVLSQAATPDAMLPHNLPAEFFEQAQAELEGFKADPEQENVVEGLVALVMGIQAANGATQTTHEEISEMLNLYIQMLSIEKLHRMGIVESYDKPDFTTIFDQDRAIDVKLNETLSALLPPDFLDALK